MTPEGNVVIGPDVAAVAAAADLLLVSGRIGAFSYIAEADAGNITASVADNISCRMASDLGIGIDAVSS